ncbi:hypothetical protein GCM10023196_002300 [Actinoallomurus vinaceus]|uniref:Peptidase S11 D-alanyl-D-alanine carboxypeptidase A N-terminal domain-containing protein n=1 Tax=Actinoallomurus vinaceus TaxID=1080074 RepID=A0ABP8U251_9ACTN
MNGASREPDNDAQHETSGTPPQDDPAPGPESPTEAGAEEGTDTDSGARVEPASDQEESSERAPESEAETAAEAEAEPDRPSEASRAEEEEDETAEAEDEQQEDQERPEPSAERAEPAEPAERAEPDEGVEPDERTEPDPDEGAAEPASAEVAPADAASDGDDDTDVPEDAPASPDTEDTATTGDTALPEDAPAPEPASPEDATAPSDDATPEPESEPEEPEPGTEEGGPGSGEEDQEDGRAVTAEFRLPPKLHLPAASDITVSDLPRSAFPKKRPAGTEAGPPAPHRPSAEEPQPTRSAPEWDPWSSSGGTKGETEPIAPSPAADTTSAPPAPDRGAPEPSSWFSRPEHPPANAYPPPPQTVEEALPEIRPISGGGLASTTQRDGLPIVSPPPAATTAYRATPPPVMPPTITKPPTESTQPPVAEVPQLTIPPTIATPRPETARPPMAEAPPLTMPPATVMPPPATVRPPMAEAPTRTPAWAPAEAPAQAPAWAPAEAPAEEPRRKRRRTGWIVAVVVMVLLAGVVTGQLVRPMPKPTVRLTLTATRHTFDGAAPALPWPGQGQATLYVDGLGSMGSSGGEAPTPTASVAKVMTAYVFLRDHPLQRGADGPTYRISRQEAARLPMRKERGESLVEVVAGQAFTEHKALEALLLVSANNVAHELARWDVGNEQAFVEKMNAAARSLGMTNTTYTDPSGYDSRTVSTAADQVKLLTAAMKIPAFAEAVSLRSYVPNDGRPPRTAGNVLVGHHGVVGGKTGYTDAAGGNFVFAARKRTGHVTTLIVGAVMGQQSPSAMGAIEAAQPLIVAAENALTSVTLAPTGARVGLVDDGLGGRTPLRATAPVTVVGWGGLTVPVRVTGDPPRHASGGTRLGAVTAGSATIPLALDRELKPPSILKRLLRLR